MDFKSIFVVSAIRLWGWNHRNSTHVGRVVWALTTYGARTFNCYTHSGVALISGYGEKLIAVRIGFLLCWAFRIGVEAMLGISNRGIGYILSKYAYFHNVEWYMQ